MRVTLAVAFVAVMCAPQGAVAQDDWRKAIADATDRYEADRVKLRERFDKNHQNLERREKDFLALARDEFGMSEASMMDPQTFRRGADARLRLMQFDDSSVARFVVMRRSGDVAAVRQAITNRLASAQSWTASVDTALKYAKEMRKLTQKSLDNLKAEDKPGADAARRNYIKRMLDYYDKLDRVAAARAAFYGDYSEMFRRELGMLEREIALLSR